MNRPIHQFTFNKLCETVAAIMYQHGPEILPLGPDGVLIRFSETLDEPANRAALAFGEKLKSKSPEGVIEIATSLVSVFVRFQPNVIRRKALGQYLRQHLEGVDWSNVDLPQGRTLWRIPATFGGEHGPQLEDVANAAGLDPDAAVAELWRNCGCCSASQSLCQRVTYRLAADRSDGVPVLRSRSQGAAASFGG